MTKICAAHLLLRGLGLALAGLFACSRPEPSKSNVGRLGESTVLPPVDSISTQRTTPHESERTVANQPPALPSASSAGGPAADLANLLARTRKGGKTSVDYVVPEAATLAAYQGYVKTLLDPAKTDNATFAQPPDGFQLERPAPNLVALVEQPSRRRGAAAVVVRTGAATAVAVEVPHSFFDEGTLPIGLALFETIGARLLLVNTVHRYRSLAGQKPEDSAIGDDTSAASESDVAHAQRSFFLAAHEAFTQACPKGVALQVHGFRDDKSVGFEAILSAATTTAKLEPMVTHLGQALGIKVALYPRDTRQLGGTKNAQALLSRRRQQAFIHLELSQSLRQRLVHDEASLERFAASIAKEVR